MYPVVDLLRYIPYNLILSRIITGRCWPAAGTSLLSLLNVNSMPANLGTIPSTVKAETLVLSQCPEFYAEKTLILLQAIYLGLFWLGGKLLLTMLTGKPQLQDLNPDTLRDASLQNQPPVCPQILGQEPEQDLTSENPLKIDESKSPTLTLPTLKVSVNPANQQASLAIEPKIT
ncbi:hypothetical protein DSO57_1000785 [Entomophthora muscae]|uniref:Uncharacterized protein n=1 Tax=Entomophthora muscae TaxID=34485 RepID=A0ACC2T9G0_9FUNG|nr:hypothetical protein DSO57_1000785 [Entomophthora muscae]